MFLPFPFPYVDPGPLLLGEMDVLIGSVIHFDPAGFIRGG